MRVLAARDAAHGAWSMGCSQTTVVRACSQSRVDKESESATKFSLEAQRLKQEVARLQVRLCCAEVVGNRCDGRKYTMLAFA